jgi:hypothetical protein
MKKSLPLLAVLILAGCAHQVWMKPGATQQDFGTDNYNCLGSSQSVAPPVVASSAGWSNGGGLAHADNKGYTKRWSNGGGSVAPVDMNQGMRNELYSSCLQSKGWQLITVEDK